MYFCKVCAMFSDIVGLHFSHWCLIFSSNAVNLTKKLSALIILCLLFWLNYFSHQMAKGRNVSGQPVIKFHILSARPKGEQAHIHIDKLSQKTLMVNRMKCSFLNR